MVRLFIILLGFFISTQVFASECGLFRVVKGNVTYKEKDKTSFTKARINKKVCQGDTVKTDTDARAKIVMADTNELNISPNSELLIEVYKNASNGEKQVLLDVVYGKVRSNVKQKYEDSPKSHYRVKTKSAVAGVRGTEFMASFNAMTSESKIVTFEGEVMVGELKGGQFIAQVSVKPGQFTSNKVGSAPHPAKEVPAKELATIEKDSNVSESPRNVSGEKNQSEPKKDEIKDDKKNNKDLKKEEPKKDEPKANTEKNSDKKEAGDKSSAKEKGPTAAPPANNKNPGKSIGSVNKADKNSGGRSVASVEPKDSLGLPPPNLNDMPKMGDLGGIKPPTFPTMVNPILPPLPTCLTCNDAIINQKVNVTIIPVLPGG